jgi:hypothetical protein
MDRGIEGHGKRCPFQATSVAILRFPYAPAQISVIVAQVLMVELALRHCEMVLLVPRTAGE